MNKELTSQIIKHIFAGLAIIPSNFTDLNKTKSLKSKEFLLKETIDFDTANESLKNHIWGCQLSVDKQEIKILLGNCSSSDSEEYALLIQLKDSPSYGCYLMVNDLNKSLIACSIDNKKWLQCNTYLQATFLAGMENIKEIGLVWNKCINYTENYQSLQSFIKYYNLVYEAEYEGKES